MRGEINDYGKLIVRFTSFVPEKKININIHLLHSGVDKCRENFSPFEKSSVGFPMIIKGAGSPRKMLKHKGSFPIMIHA